MCTIEVKGIQITLTKEQLDLIDQQRNKITDYTQIKSYEDACKVLNYTPRSLEDYDNDLVEFNTHKLRKITEAINTFLRYDGNNLYYPYFKKLSGGGLVFYNAFYDYYCYDGQVCYTYNNDSSDYLGKTFIDLYEILYKEHIK